MTTSRTDRLRDGRDIDAVLRGRRSRAGHLVVLHARERDDDGPARVATIASRRVGNAVARNRAKRLLREASARTPWAPGTDLVLIARARCATTTMWSVHAELGALADRLGVAAAATADAAS